MNNMAKAIGALWVVLSFTNATAWAAGEAFSSLPKPSTRAVQYRTAPATREPWLVGSNGNGAIYIRIAPDVNLINLRVLGTGVVCGAPVIRGAGAVSVAHVIWGTLV